MKSIFALITVSLLLLSLAFGLMVKIHCDVDLLIGYALDIKESAQREDETALERSIQNFSEMWNSREHTWEFFTNHNDIDAVTISFIHITHSFAEGEYELIVLESSLLVLGLQNIHEKEIPRIENII